MRCRLSLRSRHSPHVQCHHWLGPPKLCGLPGNVEVGMTSSQPAPTSLGTTHVLLHNGQDRGAASHGGQANPQATASVLQLQAAAPSA